MGDGDALNKATLEDVCTLIDRKANISDINDTLDIVNHDMSCKIDKKTFEKAVRDQSIINATIFTDSSIARWLWKSNKTKNRVPKKTPPGI